MNLSENEAYAFLGSLLLGGLKDPALIAELCPEGWENSPLFACYYPTPRMRYEESLNWSRNFKRLGLPGQTKQEEPREDGDAVLLGHFTTREHVEGLQGCVACQQRQIQKHGG